MRRFLAGLVLCLLPALALAAFPHDTVRQLTENGRLSCSAVVVAPDKALTARHCLAPGMAVDEFPVAGGTTFDDVDIAMLEVPGLECPCATIGALPRIGDQTIAVGFAPRDGDLQSSGVSRVAFIGPLGDYMPEFKPTPLTNALYIVSDRFVLIPGDSGGGLFAMQDGEWRLIGINSIGIFDPASCIPGYGCMVEKSSGFVPAYLANELLQR